MASKVAFQISMHLNREFYQFQKNIENFQVLIFTKRF